MPKNHNLNNGDIIFQSLKEESLFNDAVSHSGAVSSMDKRIITQINHVALYVGNNTVIHATKKAGVAQQSLADFFSAGRHHVIATIDNALIIQQALTRVITCLGSPYNHSFHPDAEGFYCSELITYAFKTELCDDYFQLYPMNFKDLTTQQILPYWNNYYDCIKQTIPQGVLGSHPQQLLRQFHLFKTVRLFFAQ
ncbi:YiiX/YebB-like N1pC/P60 family cysteine hydrolase [uncultured Gilliamella sp.]|jgi:Uncharacterized distant relative of cell wall-associated hydrolases|uniref:YiiX/YebB-like N1pC/P60 family cysteine hydrolase n=1 Tax=uncultured Gilliamella sp. TaxID=1193505 RepID=UPI0025F08D52|nr:YiiX/YebB-like N1pC/P60 family cysteine hydrolase [uncultured Gilliamella sp.]